MTRLSILFACAGLAFADVAVAQSARPVPPVTAAAMPAALADRAPMDLRELSAISGGTGVTVSVLSNQQLTATTSGNSIEAGSVVSGAVNFSPSALNGFSGVGNFVVNTGANNTLQGAINISIVTAPPQ